MGRDSFTSPNGVGFAAKHSMHTLDYDPVETLLKAGLVHLELGELDDARRSFEEVLRREPAHVEALAGLDAITRCESRSPLIIGPSDETEISALMRDGRYEEALVALRRTRESNPADPAIKRSIRIVESYLERRDGQGQEPGPKRKV